MRPSRGMFFGTSAAFALLGIAACVDLFHSTDFATLCTLDAAACEGDAEGSDAPAEATPTDIDFCKWTSAEARAHAERACGWLGACLGVLEQSSYAACSLRALAAYDCTFNPSLRPRGATQAQWACLANVRSCADVKSCVFGGPAPVCKGVPSGTFTGCTEGLAVVECGLPAASSPPVGVESCLIEGRRCTTVDDSTALCTGKNGVACTGVSRCSGTHVVDCKATTDVGIDCAAFGSGRCEQDDTGVVGCAPIDTAGDCTGPSRVVCDANGVARRCVGGRLVSIDCDAIGQPCTEPAKTGPSFIDPISLCRNDDAGTKCSGRDECDGDVLRSCVQGKLFELSCSRIGLGRCTKPSPDAPVATCTPPP